MSEFYTVERPTSFVVIIPRGGKWEVYVFDYYEGKWSAAIIFDSKSEAQVFAYGVP